ncbi:hypothetical protein ACIPJ2_00195 [Curtobacterium sp. NPDC090217]|uniref:hypothetical protein n=1 Tax=Curtobacterium sp. NPDC090217 TaxID=3363970 RepID=UPI00381AA9C7
MSRSRRATTGAAARRVARSHRGPLVAIAAVVYLATVAGAVVLPVLGGLQTAGVQHDLTRATPVERDLQATFVVAEPGSAPADVAGSAATDPVTSGAQAAFVGIAPALDDARRAMPAVLRSATRPGEYVAQTELMPLAQEPSKPPAYIAIAADPGFAGRSHIVEGRAPRPSTDPGAIEVVLSRPVASAVEWPVGTTRVVADTGGETTMDLVGTYAADDPKEDAWTQTPTTLRPAKLALGPGGTAETGVAYAAPGSAGALAGNLRAVHGRAWFALRPDAVTTANRAALSDAARTTLSRLTPLPSTVSGSARLTTGLPGLLDAAAARDATVGTLTAALGTGPLVAVVGVMALVALLTVERDRDRWQLLAARGGGRVLRGGLAALLVACAAVPAALLGAGTAAAVLTAIGAGSDAGTGTLAAGITVAASASAVVPCLAAAALVPGGRSRARAPRLRLVVESAVLVATAVAAFVSARAGIATAAPDGRIDPLAAALPVLLAASGTVLATRLLPVALRVVVRAFRRGADLAGLLGSITTARGGVARTVAIGVTTAGVAVALLGSVVGSTLVHGLDEAARRSVGATVSIEAPALDDDQVTAIGRVRGVASATGIATTDAVSLDTRSGTVTSTLLVGDSAALGATQRGIPGALPTPRALRGPATASVPVVVSESLAEDLRHGGSVLGTRVRVVGTAPDPSPFTDAAKWMLVDVRNASDLTSTGSVDRVLVALSLGADVDRVVPRLRAAAPDGTVQTASSVARELTADPRVPGVRTIAVVAALLGVVIGAGALAASGLLAAAGRRERGRLLATLGLDRRRNRRVIVAESVPLLVTIVVAGVVVAAAAVVLMLPAADLRSFTGSPVQPPVALDPWVFGGTVAVVVVALLTVLVVEVAAGTPPAHRPSPRPQNRSRP